VSNLAISGGALAGGMTSSGAVSGSLDGTLTLGNTAMLNEAREGISLGSSVSFDVQFSGSALATSRLGNFGSLFSVSLLSADDARALETSDPSSAVVRIAVNPNGSTDYLPNADGPSVAHVAVALPVQVADAPLQATLAPIQPVEGAPFTGTIATLVDGNQQAE